MIVLYQSLFYIIVFYYFIIVSCFHLSLASWLLFSNKVQFSSVQLRAGYPSQLAEVRDPPGRGQTVLQVDRAHADGIRFVGDTTTSIRRAYRDVGSDHASVKIEGVPTAADRRRGQPTSGSTLLVEVKQLWSAYQIGLLTLQTLTCINIHLQTNTLLLFVMLMMA